MFKTRFCHLVEFQPHPKAVFQLTQPRYLHLETISVATRKRLIAPVYDLLQSGRALPAIIEGFQRAYDLHRTAPRISIRTARKRNIVNIGGSDLWKVT